MWELLAVAGFESFQAKLDLGEAIQFEVVTANAPIAAGPTLRCVIGPPGTTARNNLLPTRVAAVLPLNQDPSLTAQPTRTTTRPN